MGSVRQAVLEFDQEVRAPWRPRLVPDVEAAPMVVRHPSRRAPSRVGVCEQPSGRRPVAPRRVDGAGAVRVVRSAAPIPVRGRPALAARTAPVGVRVSGRARRLAIVLALGCGVALGSWLDTMVGGGSDLRLAGESAVVVQSGDTLWSIATALDGEGDVRAVVDAIQELNGLDGTALVPGQVLVLP